VNLCRRNRGIRLETSATVYAEVGWENQPGTPGEGKIHEEKRAMLWFDPLHGLTHRFFNDEKSLNYRESRTLVEYWGILRFPG
jgi:hypothetical protein